MGLPGPEKKPLPDTVPGASSAIDSALRTTGSFFSSAAVITVLELTLVTSIGGMAVADTVTVLNVVVLTAAAPSVIETPEPGDSVTVRLSTTAPSFFSETV